MEFAATQTKSAFADWERIKDEPAQAGFAFVGAVSTARPQGKN
jgi:hypothetical protein